MYVAPHEGAWIEIAFLPYPSWWFLSHPTRVRGLKLRFPRISPHAPGVAPHEGAWIEIRLCLRNHWQSGVAPHEGAWIEIAHLPDGGIGILSHPTRVRGLKSTEVVIRMIHHLSHPTRVRGLKSHGGRINVLPGTSHPTRVRGLKFQIVQVAEPCHGRTPRGCVD